MGERDEPISAEGKQTGVNLWYAAAQLAKILKRVEQSDDPAIHEREQAKLARWEAVLANILTGSVEYGSRAPVRDVPAWATLEVVTGGFATGQLLAAGPLREHERALLADLPGVELGAERRALNAFFLSERGLRDLQDRLARGEYEIDVPEEAALLVVAWLAQRGHIDQARALIESIAPFFDRLRFYPIPSDKAQLPTTSLAHLQTVADSLNNLKAMPRNSRVLAQKEAVEIWAPLYDQMIQLFAETVVEGEPGRTYPTGWAARATHLLERYARLRTNHRLCSKPDRPKYHFAQVRELLRRASVDPQSLSEQNIARLRTILQRYTSKHGAPGSAECVTARQRQLSDVDGPTHQQIATVVVGRLENYAHSEALDTIDPLIRPISEQEATAFGMAQDVEVPESIARKVERCLNLTIDELVERGLITSGEMLAKLLPQITSGLRARGFSDSTVRVLYAATYRAFRRRRSLLLLDLQSQVRMEELPWVAAMERFRDRSVDERQVARQALEEVAALTFSSFPHVILPNKLLQELRSLVQGAGLRTALVDELAADIFTGHFSPKFVQAAHTAAMLLQGSLYARYFDIDYRRVLEIELPRHDKEQKRDEFAELCASRAGVVLGESGRPAENGMVIEQQQILTTQNLAALFVDANLVRLGGQLETLAQNCFKWICMRHRMKIDDQHAQLTMIKNTAYAWRQMIFYLSMRDSSYALEFVRWAHEHLREQSADFQQRFEPALRGLAAATEGKSAHEDGGRQFVGWTRTRHWLLSTSRV